MKNSKNDYSLVASFVPVKKPKHKSVARVNDTVDHNEIQSQQPIPKPVVTITAPVTVSALDEVIECLKNGNVVIADLGYKKQELLNKVLEYLGGATTALGGRLEKLYEHIYLLLPNSAQLNKK